MGCVASIIYSAFQVIPEVPHIVIADRIFVAFMNLFNGKVVWARGYRASVLFPISGGVFSIQT